MANPRFYVSNLPTTGSIELDPVETRHASNVLRLVKGDSVALFDGLGHEALGHVERVTKRAMLVQIDQHRESSRELLHGLTMIVALPKGDRQKTLVDGLTQLGVTQLTPLNCLRSVAQPTSQTIQRLERVVIETSKQCGRNVLMKITQPVTIADLTKADEEGSLSIFAHPYGDATSLSRTFSTPSKGARIVIGPEGGLADDEVQLLADSGWKQLSLGRRILRVELAAIAAAACWALNDSQP